MFQADSSYSRADMVCSNRSHVVTSTKIGMVIQLELFIVKITLAT